MSEVPQPEKTEESDENPVMLFAGSELNPNISHVPIRSRFGKLPIGEPVVLYEGQLTLSNQRVVVAGTGKITFEFVPALSVRFAFQPNEPLDFLLIITEIDFDIEMVDLGRTEKAKAFESSGSWPSGEAKISGVLSSFQFSTMRENDTTEPIGRIQFHLVNFCNFRGDFINTIEQGQSSRRPHRTRFEFDNWVVTLDALPDISQRLKQVKLQGGLVVTHVGDLRRKDGKLFGVKKAAELMQFQHWFLSFVNGSRCGCVLSSGLRYLKEPLWVDWSPQITRSGKNNPCWFEQNLPDECLSIAGKFYSFWRDIAKRDWVQLAVSIYTDSNRNGSGTDLELTKSQIALEMLCWIMLREESTIISEEGLEKLPASDKIRLLLSICGIPLAIPDSLTDLVDAFKSTPGVDGPQATTEIRNNITHLTKKNRGKLFSYSDMVKYDAWQLNMWYVELVMLKLFGYMGHYNNRVNRHSYEGVFQLVPWAQTSQ